MRASAWPGFWRARVPHPREVAAAGLALLTGACTAEGLGWLDGYGTGGRLWYGVAGALLILGIVAWEQSGTLAVPPWMGRLGAASYSIYLFQFLFFDVAWVAWQFAGLPAGVIAWLVLSCAAIGGGMVVATHVEQPLLRRLRA